MSTNNITVLNLSESCSEYRSSILLHMVSVLNFAMRTINFSVLDLAVNTNKSAETLNSKSLSQWTRAHTNTHTQTHTHTRTLSLSLAFFIYVCIYIYSHKHIHIYVYINKYGYIHVYTCIYIHVYIYAYSAHNQDPTQMPRK